jgi:hypothetical protein
MATRSHIAKRNSDGSITSIYCHWDGYPENNGVLLEKHYKDESKLDSLLAIGNLSSLAPEIGDEPHDFNNAPDGICNFYGRDRKEPNQESSTLSEAGFKRMLRDSWADYVYLFENGEWKYSHLGTSGNTSFNPLAPAIARHMNE